MTYDKQKKIIKFLLVLIIIFYIGFFFYGTIFSRSSGLKYIFKSELFWSYKEWFYGASAGKSTGDQIIENLVVLIPVGFLISSLLSDTKWKEWKKLLFVAGISLGLSVIAEGCQLVFRLGTCELDDLMNNTISGCTGYGCYRLFHFILNAIFKKCKNPIWDKEILFGWGCVLIGLICLIAGPLIADIQKEEDSSIQDFVFQLDNVEMEENNLVLSGFTFILEPDSVLNGFSKPEIILKPTKGIGKKKLDTEYGEKRTDVNNYFLCEYDYSNSGFTASVSTDDVDLDREYEVLVSFGHLGLISTDTYITGTNIHYALEDTFEAPKTEGTDLDTIVKNGILRVYRPDQYCWVYQYDGCLYWIVEKGFTFEEDGSTYIQYQLNTTQIENLPQKRLENHWYWDNIGGCFEDYEITDEIECGDYRVMKRELPTEYSITDIVTGYYVKGWIWKKYFRPFYEF